MDQVLKGVEQTVYLKPLSLQMIVSNCWFKWISLYKRLDVSFQMYEAMVWNDHQRKPPSWPSLTKKVENIFAFCLNYLCFYDRFFLFLFSCWGRSNETRAQPPERTFINFLVKICRRLCHAHLLAMFSERSGLSFTKTWQVVKPFSSDFFLS